MQITLKALRINKRETQEETAREIKVSVDTWSNYENGKTFPDVPVIQRIEKHFNVKYDDINFLINNYEKVVK